MADGGADPCPGMQAPPMNKECEDLYNRIDRQTYRGHVAHCRGMLKGYHNMVDRWRESGCPGDPPGLPSEYQHVPNPNPRPAPGPGIDPLPIVGAGGAAAWGYVLYRLIRQIPSLLPPAWPTFIPNLLVP